jgi:hypothetical protein
MAGSLGLNQRFEHDVQRMIGIKEYSRIHETVGFAQVISQFDKSIKTAFRGDLKEEYFVTFPCTDLPDKLSRNLKKDCWTMKG